MSALQWIMAAISITGVVLNVYKNRVAFILWIATNGFWAVTDFIHGLYAQSLLFAIYFILAIYGVWKWSKK